jgi:hypothetical protein
LDHRAGNPVSVKNLTATETSTIVKLLRPYVPVGTKMTRALGRPRRRWENNIRMDLMETGWESVDWIHMVQDRNKHRGLVNAVMNLSVRGIS